MRTRIRRPSPAMLVALVALFASLGGIGYAAATIGTSDIKDGAVTKKKLHARAVTAKKIKKEAVKTGKLAEAAVKTDKLAFQSVTEEKLASDAVTTGKLADQSITNGKLAGGAVHASQLGPIETVAKIEPIPANGTKNLIATCPPGTTLINGGGSTSSFAVHMVGSLAFQEENVWSASWQNTSNAEHNVLVRANCLSE